MPVAELSVSAFNALPDDKQTEWKHFARVHGADPDETYRIVVDDGSVTFYRYARNEQGNFYTDGDELAQAEPLTVALRAEVPA